MGVWYLAHEGEIQPFHACPCTGLLPCEDLIENLHDYFECTSETLPCIVYIFNMDNGSTLALVITCTYFGCPYLAGTDDWFR